MTLDGISFFLGSLLATTIMTIGMAITRRHQ